MLAWARQLLAAVAVITAHSPALANPSDASLLEPLTVERAIAVALAHNPGLRAANHRARGEALLAEAARKPDAPSLGLDLWQVPLARPWAIHQASMAMVSLRQPIPAAGSLRRRAVAGNHAAAAVAAEHDRRAQDLALAVRHAFIDYEAVSARHALHLDHREISEQVLGLARARQTTSGTLLDIARAETEAARAHADVSSDASTIAAARTRLNSLLARPADAPLGPPVPLPAETVTTPARTLIAEAQQQRPERHIAAKLNDAATMTAAASRREAAAPAAEVGLAYFAATPAMPYHGYGVLVSIQLPWLSGQARKRRDADAAFAAAAREDLDEVELQIAREIAEALASAQTAARRWQALTATALPASARARAVALSGYEVGRADLVAMLSTEATHVEIAIEIIDAKANLDHALADLERAAGAPVERVPLHLQIQAHDHPHPR